MSQAKATADVRVLETSHLENVFVRDAENPSVCVVDGFGVRILTRSGRLVVGDGVGTQRRERIFTRANHQLSRVVICARNGQISLDATRWIQEAGISLVQIDPSTEQIVLVSADTANDDARLRRAQALAPGTETGLKISAYLCELKLAGQASIADQWLKRPDLAATIHALHNQLEMAGSLEEIRQVEAAAANVYWSCWSSLSPQFVKKDQERVPANWLIFEGRRSAIGPALARHASDPANAMLNYLYRLLEAEVHIATVAVGLDPGLGILHADMKARSSLVLDVMEALRPAADLHLLRILASQPLRWRDFHEDGKGMVRVLAPLTHRLTEAMPGFASSIAPVVERIAQQLASASPYDVTNPSVLTKEKHRAAARRRVATANRALSREDAPIGPGAAGLAPRTKRRQRPKAESEPALPLPICRGCGAVLEREPDRIRRRGSYCPTCLGTRRSELGADLPSLSATARSKGGALPSTHSPEASARRRQQNAARKAEEAAWDSTHPSDAFAPDMYSERILPHLGGLTLTQIAKATGISTSSASKVRAGRMVPHQRHWVSLIELMVESQMIES